TDRRHPGRNIRKNKSYQGDDDQEARLRGYSPQTERVTGAKTHTRNDWSSFRQYLINYQRFFFSSRRRHTRFSRDWSSDVCSSDLPRSPSAYASWRSRCTSMPGIWSSRRLPRCSTRYSSCASDWSICEQLGKRLRGGSLDRKSVV